MTELGKEQIINDSQIDKIAEVMERRALAEKQPAFAHLLKPEQVEAMVKVGLMDKEDIRSASDEDLIKIKSVGLAAVQILRDWSVEDLKKGTAIARRYLVLKDGKDRLDVSPGDEIPARFGAEEMVAAGKASWQ
jgi:hypothetical protein